MTPPRRLLLLASLTWRPIGCLVHHSSGRDSFADDLRRMTRADAPSNNPPPFASFGKAAADADADADADANPGDGATLGDLRSQLMARKAAESATPPENDVPPRNGHGVHQLRTKEQHAALLKANPDKLVVVKFYAKFCKACAALAPKYLKVADDPQLRDLPIVWAEFESSKASRGFFRRLGILSLPTVHFYDGTSAGMGIVENFPAANVKTLKTKLAQFLNERVDPDTRALVPKPPRTRELSADLPVKERFVIGDELIQKEHLDYLRDGMPFFEDLTDEEFHDLISKTKLRTYLPGDIIIRQGMPGDTFFVIKSGLVEMCIRSRYEDPISTPASYLGAVVNEIGKFGFFGERALSTGEPLAASVRVIEKTRCFAFHVDVIPESCILSKKRRATRAMVEKLTKRYALPEDYVPPSYPTTARDESLLDLLVRFKQVRQAARCFEYIMTAKPMLGDEGQIARRTLLASKLSPSQKQDYVDVFNLADTEKTGTICLLGLRRFMESARKDVTERDLMGMINTISPLGRGSGGWNVRMGITLDEYLGVMAEAEFYHLFRDTFQELDVDETGYVRAGDLDDVLGGIRDLISDDRRSLIDVEDKDIQVDYEQFARMLLGASL